MAKAEPKTILKAYSTVESKLPTLPLEDGQLIFVYDKKKIILDNHGVRTVYEQIQTIETEEQRNDLLAPIDSFYFVIETSILWRYSNGHWNQITTSPQEQIDRIATEGTKQVKAVRDEGQKVLQSIPEDFQTQMETKLNKQQGIENKGKVLVIGEDGNVVPGEVSSGGGDGIAIINTMSGESPLVIPDSAERVNKGLELGGKTEQVTTTGKNLFDTKTYRDMNGCEIINNNQISFIQNLAKITYEIKLDSGDYRISFKRKKYSSFTIRNGESVLHTNGGENDYGYTIKLSEPAVISIEFASGQNPNAEQKIIYNIQLEKSSTATPYEPYTGGKPSPSPEYLQEITNSGKLNADTQKYEVSVKAIGKNLFDIEKASEKANWTQHNNFPGYYNFPVFVGKDNTVTISIPQKIPTGQGLFLSVCLSESGGREGWIAHNSNASLNNAKLTYKATTDYIYLNAHSDTIAGMERFFGELQIECGNVATPYQPYTEQTLTLTSDRPLTKWDRLVEQGGEIGWLYGSVIATIDETADISLYAPNGFFIHVKNIDKREKTGYCDKLYTKKMSNGEPFVLFGIANNNFLYTLNTQEFYGKTASEIKAKLKEYPLNIIGKSETTEFVPLPQSEQNAVRNLKTYYPTTVITVDGGELDPDIKVTYTADTKNYIDNKFGKTINAMQTKLLELESRV